jgi:hypothetical protein
MSNQTSPNVREVLERPFPPEAIQTKPSNHGPLSFVATWRYIERLNAAYNGVWSFEVISHEIRENEVLVIGRLATPDCTKSAFGSAIIARKKENSEVVDLGDSLKAAASDSLKKACSLLGLGLHLWADGAMDQPTNGGPANGNGQPKQNAAPTNGGSAPANGASNGNGGSSPATGSGGNGDGQDKSRLSSKQLGLILSLAREQNISRDKLNAMTEEQFAGRRLEFISRSEASWLIQQLQQAA